MGDIADSMLQDAMDHLDEDWYEQEDDVVGYPKPIKKTCKYCKTKDLIWRELWPHKWVLWDKKEDKQHVCPIKFKVGKNARIKTRSSLR